MSMIKPSREQYKPELDLKVPGQFFARCRRVEQGMENQKFANKTNVAIEFEVQDDRFPEIKGHRTAIVCPESIYRDRETGRESYLLQYARMMGVSDAERGFDPQQFVGKWYYITVIEVEGRTVVRAALPMPAPGQTGKLPVQTPPVAAPVVQLDGDKAPF